MMSGTSNPAHANSISLLRVLDHADRTDSGWESGTAETPANFDSTAPSTSTHDHHTSACSSLCSVHCPTHDQSFVATPNMEGMEKQIERHRGIYMVPLYRKRNTFLPVSKLSWDILTDIFLRTQTRGVHAPTSDYYVYDSWTLHNITATCYAWRHAARSGARLWTDIHCSWYPELVHLYWQLSYPNLVCVRVFELDSVFKTDWQRVFMNSKFVLEHAERISQLTIHIPYKVSSEERRNVMDIISRPITGLRHVQDVSIVGGGGEDDDMVMVVQDLPFLTQALSTLRALDLMSISIRSLSLLSWNLRELRMASESMQDMATEPWRPVLIHLAPYLEVFELEVPSSTMTLSSGPPIVMLRLHHVTLHVASGFSAMSFLTNMKLERSASATIEVRTHQQRPNWSNLANFLNNHHKNDTTLTFHLSTYYCDRLSWASVDGNASFTIDPMSDYIGDYETSDIGCEAHSEAIHDLLKRMSHALRSQVVELDIPEKYISDVDGDIEASPLSWETFNAKLPNVKAITILSTSQFNQDWDAINRRYVSEPERLCSSLLAKLAADRNGHFFPRLDTLHLRSAPLRQVDSSDEADLLAALSLRTALQPIRKITLDPESRISVVFRGQLAQVSPFTVVEVEGKIVPVPSCEHFYERFVRGRHVIAREDWMDEEMSIMDQVQECEIKAFTSTPI